MKLDSTSALQHRPFQDDASATLAARLPGLARLLTPAEVDGAGAVTQDVSSSSRPVAAEVMLNRVLPYLADYGITRIADLTYLDRLGLPVHTAYKPMGLSLSSGSGKGLTAVQSRLGAAMEAIEQTYWETTTLTTIHGSRIDLERMGLVTVDGDDLVRPLGSIWSEHLPIHWTPMYDLVSGNEVWVPCESVMCGTRPGMEGFSFLGVFTSSSNGLASGFHVADALVAGLTEVLERDGVTIAKVTRSESVDTDELVARVGGDVAPYVEHLTSHGVRLGLTDATSEAELPTYIATLWDLEDPRIGTFSGYGTGFDEHRALVRAITEAVQSRGLISAGARDDQYAIDRRAARRRISCAVPSTNSTKKATTHIGMAPTDSIAALEVLLAAAARCECPQVLVMRYSSPGDPAQVVRVVVPGLEGYKFPSYSPGSRARAALARLENASMEARP